MLVSLQAYNVKSCMMFKNLLNHHQVAYQEIQMAQKSMFQIDEKHIKTLEKSDFRPFIRDVQGFKTSYQLVSRNFQKQDSVVHIKNNTIGGGHVLIMAGPCSVENRDSMTKTATALKAAGVKVIRGGAYKPRTSPYSFQGLGLEGLKILREVADAHGMAAVSEVVDVDQMDHAERYLDCIQIGARNMQHYALLKRAGQSSLPILLKRGPSATIEEFLLAAEYIYSNGNPNIILCERGIKTFEPMTRNTFDINAVALLKTLTHLPILADPSHGTGLRALVTPVGLSALIAGADGLLIEAHHTPDEALSDADQTISCEEVHSMMMRLDPIKEVKHVIS